MRSLGPTPETFKGTPNKEPPKGTLENCLENPKSRNPLSRKRCESPESVISRPLAEAVLLACSDALLPLVVFRILVLNPKPQTLGPKPETEY